MYAKGVASEAASLAGHLKLNNLCLIYDDNNIQIDGDTDLAFTENVVKDLKHIIGMFYQLLMEIKIIKQF